MKIDVHAHFVPEAYRDALGAAGVVNPDGMPWIPEWSAEMHLATLDRLGIQKAMLSISSPGVHLVDTPSETALARQVNELGRRTVVDSAGRFGLLASLPLTDVDATMAEIAYCYDHFHVDGFIVLSNIAGAYLSDPIYSPVFREFNRRSSRVLLHPTSPVCWEHTALSRPRPMLEFLFDTTRVVVDLILNGTIASCPDMTLIVPHAGAALGVVADRVQAFGRLLAPEVDVLGDLRRLHYDLAGYAVPRQLAPLLALTTTSHLHYGSDFPWTPEPVVAAALELLSGVEGLVGELTTNSTSLFLSSM